MTVNDKAGRESDCFTIGSLPAVLFSLVLRMSFKLLKTILNMQYYIEEPYR